MALTTRQAAPGGQITTSDGSVYLSRAARQAASAGAMSATACCLAALSAAGLIAAVVMTHAVRNHRPPNP